MMGGMTWLQNRDSCADCDTIIYFRNFHLQIEGRENNVVKKKKKSEKQQMAAEIKIINNLLMWKEREREAQ